MTSPRAFLIPTLVLATALLGACGGDDDTASDTTAAETTETTAAETTETTAAETTETTSETEEETTSEAVADGDVVTMEESRFLPDTLEVAAGTEVTWENTDPYAHTVTSADGSAVEFDSGELAQDETFSQTFDEAGTYDYFCQIHPTMRAEVVVS